MYTTCRYKYILLIIIIIAIVDLYIKILKQV